MFLISSINSDEHKGSTACDFTDRPVPVFTAMLASQVNPDGLSRHAFVVTDTERTDLYKRVHAGTDCTLPTARWRCVTLEITGRGKQA